MAYMVTRGPHIDMEYVLCACHFVKWYSDRWDEGAQNYIHCVYYEQKIMVKKPNLSKLWCFLSKMVY